jgi:MOSC domain-containing protein YiiM
MKIVSCNVGVPQLYEFEGQSVSTSMVRLPQKSILVKTQQVQGDAFAGPHLHGTPEAVVYALSTESYVHWSKALSRPMNLGHFGENLSIEALREEDFYIDDLWQAGTATLKVTGPRYPCNRLNFVTQRSDMRQLFAEYAKPGVYFSVVHEGVIHPGDELKLIQRVQDQLHVLDVYWAMRASEKKSERIPSVDKVLNYPPLWSRYRDRVAQQFSK